MSYLDEYIKKQKQYIDPITAQKEQAVLDSAAASKQQLQKDYETGVVQTREEYEKALDDANLSRVINERRIKENLANMGYSDSGLAETQMTALQIAQSNAQSKALRQRQVALDILARTVQSQNAEIDRKANDSIADIRIAANESILSGAQQAYQDDIDAYNEAIKTAEDKQKDKAKARDTLVTTLTQKDDKGNYLYIGENAKANQGIINALMKNYFDQYGADDTDYDVFKNLGQDIDGWYGYNYLGEINQAENLKNIVAEMWREGVNSRKRDEAAQKIERAISNAYSRGAITYDEAQTIASEYKRYFTNYDAARDVENEIIKMLGFNPEHSLVPRRDLEGRGKSVGELIYKALDSESIDEDQAYELLERYARIFGNDVYGFN